MNKLHQADIGVFGGSGFYSFLPDVQEVQVDTPYGPTSDHIFISQIGPHKVAFMPRHGRQHTIPPHLINYRANVWAMKQLGCQRVISTCAAGSLQRDIKPGSFVICDQFVDWTDGREGTFLEGPHVQHPSPVHTYCPQLRRLALETAQELQLDVHAKGTMVVINGPRYSTQAESAFFTRQGWHLVGMTGYPENYLVKELNMCPLSIALITDYDAGLVADMPPVSHEEVLSVFTRNMDKLKELLFKLIGKIPSQQADCSCGQTVQLTE